jgi:hypothetical protein
MARRAYITTAFAFAILATIIGWSQTFIYYVNSPVIPAICWFPLVVLVQPLGDVEMIVLSLIQFPLFATLFVLGIHRWSVATVLSVLGVVYILMIGIAFLMVR